MNSSNFNNQSPKKLDEVLESEQITQIVKAILEGKYSWACVLILNFYGYNPLHYIPYRTYKRLIKQNRQNGKDYQVSSEETHEIESTLKIHALKSATTNDANFL